MIDTPATRIDLSGPQLRADQAGYDLDGESVDGFADRPDLDPTARRQLAAWAAAFGHDLDEAQRELLAVPAPEDGIGLEILKAATRNLDVDLPLAHEFGLQDRLEEHQALLVREPWRGLPGEERREYPLNVTELAQLTGSTPKQVREWEKATLLPGYRIDGRRQFFSAAVIHAFALGGLDRFQVAALASLQSSADEDAFTRLVEQTIAARRHREAEQHPSSFADVYKTALVQTLKAFQPARHAAGPPPRSDVGRKSQTAAAIKRAARENPAMESPIKAYIEDSIARISFQRSMTLISVFDELATDEVADIVCDADFVVPHFGKRPASDETIVGGTPEPWEHGSPDIVVHPAANKGWSVSTDLGLAVRRKDDAVKLGKEMRARLGDGAMYVYSKNDGTRIAPSRKRGTPATRHGS